MQKHNCQLTYVPRFSSPMAEKREKIEKAKYALMRATMVFCLATVLTFAFGVLQEPAPVSAAPATSTIRQDRRPDGERPVTTSSSTSGSSSTTSGSQLRSRLVRR